MALDRSNWRSASGYTYAETLAAPEMAWEWLRRNEDYQRDYSRFATIRDDPRPLTRRVRQRWGLRFPDRSASIRP